MNKAKNRLQINLSKTSAIIKDQSVLNPNNKQDISQRLQKICSNPSSKTNDRKNSTSPRNVKKNYIQETNNFLNILNQKSTKHRKIKQNFADLNKTIAGSHVPDKLNDNLKITFFDKTVNPMRQFPNKQTKTMTKDFPSRRQQSPQNNVDRSQSPNKRQSPTAPRTRSGFATNNRTHLTIDIPTDYKSTENSATTKNVTRRCASRNETSEGYMSKTNYTSTIRSKTPIIVRVPSHITRGGSCRGKSRKKLSPKQGTGRRNKADFDLEEALNIAKYSGGGPLALRKYANEYSKKLKPLLVLLHTRHLSEMYELTSMEEDMNFGREGDETHGVVQAYLTHLEKRLGLISKPGVFTDIMDRMFRNQKNKTKFMKLSKTFLQKPNPKKRPSNINLNGDNKSQEKNLTPEEISRTPEGFFDSSGMRSPYAGSTSRCSTKRDQNEELTFDTSSRTHNDRKKNLNALRISISEPKIINLIPDGENLNESRTVQNVAELQPPKSERHLGDNLLKKGRKYKTHYVFPTDRNVVFNRLNATQNIRKLKCRFSKSLSPTSFPQDRKYIKRKAVLMKTYYKMMNDDLDIKDYKKPMNKTVNNFNFMDGIFSDSKYFHQVIDDQQYTKLKNMLCSSYHAKEIGDDKQARSESPDCSGIMTANTRNRKNPKSHIPYTPQKEKEFHVETKRLCSEKEMKTYYDYVNKALVQFSDPFIREHYHKYQKMRTIGEHTATSLSPNEEIHEQKIPSVTIPKISRARTIIDNKLRRLENKLGKIGEPWLSPPNQTVFPSSSMNFKFVAGNE